MGDKVRLLNVEVVGAWSASRTMRLGRMEKRQLLAIARWAAKAHTWLFLKASTDGPDTHISGCPQVDMIDDTSPPCTCGLQSLFDAIGEPPARELIEALLAEIEPAPCTETTDGH